MKKIIIATIAIVISFSINAQEHLTFKGIPIEGSISEFCQKLTSKGLTLLGSENNVTIFTGDFTGRNANIGVTATDDGNNVYAVVVMFDASKEWNVLVDTYDYYKDLYSRKYGNPVSSIENNPSRSNTNTALMAQVHEGTVVYCSVWDVSGGDIQLSIEKTTGFYEGMVVIRYRDSQNVEAKILKDLEEI